MFVLGCSPCTPVAGAGPMRGPRDPNVDLTTDELARVANFFDALFVIGEQHWRLAADFDGSLLDAIDRNMVGTRVRRVRVPHIHGAPMGAEIVDDDG